MVRDCRILHEKLIVHLALQLKLSTRGTSNTYQSHRKRYGSLGVSLFGTKAAGQRLFDPPAGRPSRRKLVARDSSPIHQFDFASLYEQVGSCWINPAHHRPVNLTWITFPGVTGGQLVWIDQESEQTDQYGWRQLVWETTGSRTELSTPSKTLQHCISVA